MNTVRTVSDTKRSFYTLYTRPVNSIFRRVVEELMVEMHLLSVNEDFKPDGFYHLGVVTTYDRFMQGYQPDADREAIFSALVKALQLDPAQLRADAAHVTAAAQAVGANGIAGWLSLESAGDGHQSQLRAIAQNAKFKYSRLFAIGVFTLLETVNPDLVKDADQSKALLAKISTALNLSSDRFQKDLELYRSNLEKMTQTRQVMEEAIQADRKKRDERAAAQTSSDAPTPEAMEVSR